MIRPCSGSIDLADDIVELTTYGDARGDLTELFREEWQDAPRLRQWTLIRNRANVLRGMHVHLVHADFIIVVEGEMLLALHDIRPASASRGKAGVLHLTGDRLTALRVRPGIVHGFYAPRGSALVYGATHAWSRDDELACRWDDPALNLDWPDVVDPQLSERDRNAGTLAQLVAAYRAATS